MNSHLMIHDMEKERRAVFTAIFEGIKSYSASCNEEQRAKATELVQPSTEIPYFVLVGKRPDGKRIELTPAQIFQVISVSLARKEYSVLAYRAVFMSRIVAFFSQNMDIGQFNSFLDPFRSLLMMAGIAFTSPNIDLTGPPTGFDICFPFGRSLWVQFVQKEDRADLVAKLKSPGLFLSYPMPSDDFNKRERGMFSKLKAYAAENKDKPIDITITSFYIKND